MTHRSPRILLVVLLIAMVSGCSRRGMEVSGPEVEGPSSEAAELLDPLAPTLGSSKVEGDRSRLPEFDPDDFVRRIDNPYFPLIPGTSFRFEAETDEGLEVIEVTVTKETKKILGIRTTVVRDRSYLDGELIEDTIDWYAQDEDGNVWYFGEDTKELENGVVVSTDGSWLAGRNGAKPGVYMLARPRVGQSYPQERAKGVAEDRAKVLSLKKPVEVPYGEYEKTLQTFDDSPLDPTALEYKYYARGVGLVLVVDKTSGDRTELVSITK